MTGGVRKIVIILIYSILIQVRHALNAYPGFCCQLYIKWIFAMSPRKTCILSLDCTDHSLVWPFLDNCHRNRCSTYSQTTHTFSSQQWFCVQCALLHLRVHFTMYFTYFFLRALVMITKSKALKFSLLLKIFLFFLFFFPRSISEIEHRDLWLSSLIKLYLCHIVVAVAVAFILLGDWQ